MFLSLPLPAGPQPLRIGEKLGAKPGEAQESGDFATLLAIGIGGTDSPETLGENLNSAAVEPASGKPAGKILPLVLPDAEPDDVTQATDEDASPESRTQQDDGNARQATPEAPFAPAPAITSVTASVSPALKQTASAAPSDENPQSAIPVTGTATTANRQNLAPDTASAIAMASPGQMELAARAPARSTTTSMATAYINAPATDQPHTPLADRPSTFVEIPIPPSSHTVASPAERPAPQPANAPVSATASINSESVQPAAAASQFRFVEPPARTGENAAILTLSPAPARPDVASTQTSAAAVLNPTAAHVLALPTVSSIAIRQDKATRVVSPLPAAPMPTADSAQSAVEVPSGPTLVPATSRGERPEPLQPQAAIAGDRKPAAMAALSSSPPDIATPEPASPLTPQVQLPAPALSAPSAQIGTPAAPAPAQPAPQDFATLVDRLVEAREAAAPTTVRAAIRHADFGTVSIGFDQPDDGRLTVRLNSADPDFAPAVQAAAAAGQSAMNADNGTAFSRHDGSAQQQAAQTSANTSQQQQQQGTGRESPRQADASRTFETRQRNAGQEESNPRDDGIYA